MIRSVEIVNHCIVNAVLFAADTYNEELLFMSSVDKTSLIKKASRAFNKRVDVSYSHRSRLHVGVNSIDFYISKSPDSDYSNLVLWRKDIIDTTEKKFFIYLNMDPSGKSIDSMRDLLNLATEEPDSVNIKNFYHTFYEKLASGVSIPVLEKWIPWICNNLLNAGKINYYNVENTFNGEDGGIDLRVFSINVNQQWLSDLISEGLANGDISIKENAVVSDRMRDLVGLDDYLNAFSETLTKKIQTSFVPKFDPERDKISERLMDIKDYAFWKSGFKMDLFPSQKITIQALCKHFDTNKTGILIGEQGCGKTFMGATTVLSHTKKDNTFTVVMCPAHLVKKWKTEIENTMPLSEAVIVSKLKDLIKIEPYIRSSNRHKHLFVILSKEIAKMSYDERPSAIWSDSRHKFVCPDCGTNIYRTNSSNNGRRSRTREKIDEFDNAFPELFFMNKNTYNEKCPDCHKKLWSAVNKNNMNSWVKTKSGWILEKHLQPVYDRLFARIDTLDKKESAMLADIAVAIDELKKDKLIVRAPRLYSIARYIHKHYKNCLDYVILDECHLLKGKDSAQGLAAGDLINTAKHSLLLTGTLLNGYASGIFHLFFRAFPGTMLKEGFGFNDSNSFQDTFGVTQTARRRRQGTSQESVSKKELPGISPIVFTKFMLENSLFIGMDDISEGLPDYKEIPVGVNMDTTLRESYDQFAETMRQNSISGRNMARRVAVQFAQGLLIYSDQPYDQPPIVDYETDQVIYTPPDLDKNRISNKEQALLDLVIKKRAIGEKVLVYYCWTGRTELDKRFISMFKDDNIKAVALDNSVKAEDRQDWIEHKVKDDNIDVLIVNPKKVETGLDLLDFTTIVFYQTGNDPYTLRQASRRSWRLSQVNDVEVYFMFYQNTVQETLLNMMATKIQASMAIEGKFSEEGLNAMSQNEDFLTQIANSVVQGITDKVNIDIFQKISTKKKDSLRVEHELSIYRNPTYPNGFDIDNISINSSYKKKHHNIFSIANIV